MFYIPKSEIANHPFNLWKTKDSEQKLEMLESNVMLEHEKKTQNAIQPEPTEHFLTRSRRLWKRPLFLLIITSDFLTWIAVFVPYLHLVEQAR